MIEKRTVIDQIEITRDGHVQVRRADLYIEDGVEVAKKYHRHVLSPGDDTSSEADKVKAVSAAVWTDAIVKEFKDATAAETRKVMGTNVTQ